MSCICRTTKCFKCEKRMKPLHIMKDERRYCAYCGANIGMNNCKGD